MKKINNLSLLSKRFRRFYPVVIDIETAGFNSKINAILEIAVIMLTMDQKGWIKKKKSLHFHIKPFKNSLINTKAIAFNKIDPFNPLRMAISEKKALKIILSKIYKNMRNHQCNKAILVGHNASFDHGFIMEAIARSKIKNHPFHPFATFDTAALSGLALGQTVLAKACKKAGIYFDNSQAHSALYDTLKTANLFCKIVNKWKKLGGWPLKKNFKKNKHSHTN